MNYSYHDLYYYIFFTFIAVTSLLFAISPLHATSQKDNIMKDNTDYAIFGAGCFWCVESEFQAIDGVNDVISGYAGGDKASANYKDVLTKKTDHFEVVRVSCVRGIFTD